MVLKDLVDIAIGSVLSRIPKEKINATSVLPLAIQDVNSHYLIGEKLEQRFPVMIPNDYLEKAVIAKAGDVVVTLSNPKALVIEDTFNGYLVPSNMIRIRINDLNKLDPYYLSWIIGFSNDFAKVIYCNLQGTTFVKTISVDVLRETDIPLVPIDEQRKIGKLNELFWKRESIQEEMKKKRKEAFMALLNSKINNERK